MTLEEELLQLLIYRVGRFATSFRRVFEMIYLNSVLSSSISWKLVSATE